MIRLSGTGLGLIVNASLSSSSSSSQLLLRSISAAQSLSRCCLIVGATASCNINTTLFPPPCSLSNHPSSPLFGRSYHSNTQFRMASTLTLPKLPIFEAIASHNPQSTAIVHCLSRRTFKYGELLPDVSRTRDRILEAAGKSDIRGERVAFLIENSYDYVGMSYSFN